MRDGGGFCNFLLLSEGFLCYNKKCHDNLWYINSILRLVYFYALWKLFSININLINNNKNFGWLIFSYFIFDSIRVRKVWVWVFFCLKFKYKKKKYNCICLFTQYIEIDLLYIVPVLSLCLKSFISCWAKTK